MIELNTDVYTVLNLDYIEDKTDLEKLVNKFVFLEVERDNPNSIIRSIVQKDNSDYFIEVCKQEMTTKYSLYLHRFCEVTNQNKYIGIPLIISEKFKRAMYTTYCYFRHPENYKNEGTPVFRDTQRFIQDNSILSATLKIMSILYGKSSITKLTDVVDFLVHTHYVRTLNEVAYKLDERKKYWTII